jgi:hypothetical protein
MLACALLAAWLWAGVTVSVAHAFGDANHPNVGECSVAAEESPGFAQLPDCRRYELVTPPNKNGALINELFLRAVPPQIASNGQRVIAASLQCFAGPESCVAARESEGEPYLFERTADGWVTHPLAPPASLETDSWWSVNANGATALFSIPSASQSLTDDFYAREEGGSLVKLGPLAEHEVGGNSPNYEVLSQEGVVATANLSRVVYQTPGSAFTIDEGGAGSLYEYSGVASAPFMVGVSGGSGSHELISACATEPGGGLTSGTQRRYGSLSEDGRIVYFTADACGGGTQGNALTPVPANELYARIDGESADAHTVLISGSTPDTCTSAECLVNAGSVESALFEGASADGSKAFFIDTQQLTNGASQAEGNNLYVSECVGSCDDPSVERRLLDASEGAQRHGGPRVQGVVAMSEDGSHVYFVAEGSLTGSEENERHETAIEGSDNLYVYFEGRVTFVAVLSSSDATEWTPGRLVANVTPDGRYLVFTSHRALTVDDTREEGPAQVFEYDAQTRTLSRVSIGATGEYECPTTKILEEGFGCDGNEGEGNASIVETADGVAAGSVPVRSDPSMSDDGAFVFFQSANALTPGALNDVHTPGVRGVDQGLAQNVYEYHEGRVFLISNGLDTTSNSRLRISPVELLGSDVSGANVFFATFEGLAPEDPDTQRDYYDAHVCSGEEPCVAPVAEGVSCGEGGCQPAPPAVGVGSVVSGSAGLFGPGNLSAPVVAVVEPKPLTRAELLAKALKVCRVKHNKHQRAVCEAKARARYAPAHKAAKKSSRARQADARGGMGT